MAKNKAVYKSGRFLIASAIVVISLVGWFMSNGAEVSTATYKMRTVEKGEIFRAVAASGSINAVIEVEVGSQISGQIKELFADFNDEVKKGDMVALIDPEIYEMRLKQRSAELAIAKADIQSKQAQLASDEAALVFTKRDMARKQKLFDQGNVSSAMIEAAEVEQQKAQNKVLMSKAAIANSEANIQQRQSALEQARVELSRTQIRAPIDGVIIARQVDVGQTVAASMQAPTLFQIANDLREIRVEASVDEADIGQVKSGQEVSFTVDAYPDRQFGGDVEVVRLAPEMAQNVVTYTVTILAKNEDMSLLPGMTANIEIVTGRRDDVLRVPNEAIRFKPRGQPAGEEQQRSSDPSSMAPRFVKTYADQLSLTAEQKDELLTEVEAAIKSSFPSGQSGGGEDRGEVMRIAMQKINSKIEKKIREIGTPEQIKALEAMEKKSGRRGGSRGGKKATLWALDESGELVSRRVQIGLSDNNNTEILRGLKAGDQVITGYERRMTQ